VIRIMALVLVISIGFLVRKARLADASQNYLIRFSRKVKKVAANVAPPSAERITLTKSAKPSSPTL
jgi:hypothetical protein